MLSKIQILIIIPIRNANETLVRCFDSIKNSNFDYNLDILCVLDDCLDDSAEICAKYGFKTLNVNVHKPSLARNKALEICYSLDPEFIFFLDADDTLNKNALAELYKKAVKEKADLVIGSYKKMNGFFKRPAGEAFYKPGIMKKDEVLKGFLKDLYGFNFNPWGKLYRYEVIKQNHVYFPSILVCEALLFNIKFVLNAKKFVYVKKALYNLDTSRRGLAKIRDGITLSNRVGAYYWTRMILEHYGKEKIFFDCKKYIYKSNKKFLKSFNYQDSINRVKIKNDFLTKEAALFSDRDSLELFGYSPEIEYYLGTKF